jgi:hypothetical protein
VAELVQFTGDEKMDAHDDQVDMLAYFVQQMDRGGMSMVPTMFTPPDRPANDPRNIFMG